MTPFLPILAAALSLGLGSGADALPKGESLSVVSRRCDMDRISGIVLFEGQARVDYRPAYTLCADRVFALFSGTNALERLVVAGNVSITNGSRVGTCDRAVFWHKTGEIEMTGWQDGRAARLGDGDENSIAGSKIRFWLKGDQVEITRSELLVNKSGRSVRDL